MSKKTTKQPELLEETPAIVTPAEPGQAAEQLELIDDKPDTVKMDLRKFNRTKAKITDAIRPVKAITAITDATQVNSMMNFLKALDAVKKIVEAKRKELGDPYRLEVERINAHVKDILKEVDPAIAHGKALILGYHKAEEKKAKDLRTDIRIGHLRAAGLTPSPRMVGDVELIDWLFADGSRITAGQIEDLPDDIYLQILTDLVESSMAKATAGLLKEKEGADFFGDKEGVAAAQDKIEAITSAVPLPSQMTSVAVGCGYNTPTTKGLTKRWTFELSDLSQVPREYLQIDEKKIREAISAGARAIPGVRIYQDESISLR